MPTLTQLEYIMALHRYRHFGRAAKSCNVSQPSLSLQIQKAEETLNSVIFDRSTKPIQTTSDGQIIIDKIKVILDEHHKLLNLNLNEDKLKGKFNLSVIPTLSAYIVPRFIKGFASLYPNVQLVISENKTSDILKLIHANEIDAGLLVTPVKDEALHEEVLFYEPFYAFASNGHPITQKKIISSKDLDGETLWLLEEGHCFRDQVIELCKLKNKNQVLRNVTFQSGNLETLKNMIRQNTGYTLLPHLATLDLTKNEFEKNIKVFKRPVPTREVSLITKKSLTQSKISSAIAEVIIKNMPTELKTQRSQNIEVINI